MGISLVTVYRSKQLEMATGGQQLLPGIPNEITVDHIASKLPWTTFYILSCVSHGWQQVIQSRRIYNARVRAQSRQTVLALHHGDFNGTIVLALYSAIDDSCYHLPPIPGVETGIPRSCQCVSLDGKLYILGGAAMRSDRDESRIEVYVFDLAGQRKWKQCASMRHPRQQFGCGVLNGKIYVSGGLLFSSGMPRLDTYHPGTDMYDPEEDVWSPVPPKTLLRYNLMITQVGEELFVHNTGDFFDVEFFEWIRDPVIHDEMPPDFQNDQLYQHFENACIGTVYDSVEGVLRVAGDLEYIPYIYLMVGAKLHKMGRPGIDVYEMHAKRWKRLQSFSAIVLGPVDEVVAKFCVAKVVDNVIVAVASSCHKDTPAGEIQGSCIIKSQELLSKGEEIVWRKSQCYLNFCSRRSFTPFLYPIQL